MGETLRPQDGKGKFFCWEAEKEKEMCGAVLQAFFYCKIGLQIAPTLLSQVGMIR